MANEPTAVESQADGTVTPQPQAGTTTTTEPQAGESHQQENISLEEAKKLRSEAANLRKRLKSFEEAEEQAKAAKKAKEEAELSEIDRITKQHQELQGKYDAAISKQQEMVARHDITAAATKLNFLHPDLAFKLVNASEFERDSDGNVTNAADLLNKLLATYPDLAKQQETPAQPTRSRPPVIPAMSPERSSIQSAGNTSQRRPYTLSEVYPKP